MSDIKPLRIGVDLRPILTGNISGIELYTLSVLTELIQHDHDNTYVLFYVSYKNQDKLLVDLLERHPILRNDNIEIRKLKWLNFPISLHFCFKFLRWPKADLVCGGLDAIWMPSPRLLPLTSACAKVTTFHDLIFYLFPQFYTWKSRLWQHQMDYPNEARTSDRIIAVSRNTKQDLIKLLNADVGKIEVIYEGVDKSYFAEPDEKLFSELVAKWQIPSKYIYFVGSVEPRKNLITVVRALNQLKQTSNDTIKLVVSGGKQWLTSELYQTITDLGLSTDVIFTGRVTEAEKIALLQHALVFAFPSYYEGFGLMILEAFASGCPVITSNVSALPEVAGDAGILIHPTDYGELANQIADLSANSTRRAELIAKGRQIARQFTWETAAKKTLAVIIDATQHHAK